MICPQILHDVATTESICTVHCFPLGSNIHPSREKTKAK